MRKLVAALACRNNGSRLYGKPLQNLNIGEGVTILDHLIDCFSIIDSVSEVVLGISEGIENEVFSVIAEKHGISHIVGDEKDVLSRLIQCGNEVRATDIIRVTSESPFPYFEKIDESWKNHIDGDFDATFFDEIIQGCGFEIISMDSLIKSHEEGEDRHRSELCTLFIRENKDKFRIDYVEPPHELVRRDLRLTVDYPEDLILCRAVYAAFSNDLPLVNLFDAVKFIDRNPELKEIVSPLLKDGYSKMYL